MSQVLIGRILRSRQSRTQYPSFVISASPGEAGTGSTHQSSLVEDLGNPSPPTSPPWQGEAKGEILDAGQEDEFWQISLCRQLLLSNDNDMTVCYASDVLTGSAVIL